MKLFKRLAILRDLYLIYSSGLFDKDWYISQYPDIAYVDINPLVHYFRFGGLNGLDPSPAFCSAWYLSVNDDVKGENVNPLVHYLRYGRGEGRKALPESTKVNQSLYRCPVCEKWVDEFIPISSYYEEEHKKYGNPYVFDDFETINPNQYLCPFCSAGDRDRLYALYLKKVFTENFSKKIFTILDIAPSQALKLFLSKHPMAKYLTADKYMEDVDVVVDITDMDTVGTESFDIFVCSHVLEHVGDDKKALSELFRILKPDGFGILMVPINLKIRQIDEDPNCVDPAERVRRFGQYDHVRLYSKDGFVRRVEDAGFTVYQYGIDFFGRNTFLRYAISSKSILYIVKKDGKPY